MKKMLISWFAAALLACPALAAAAVLYVNPAGTWGGGQPAFTTVQQAVDAALDGDEIWVAQGTYYENVVINKGPVSGAGIKLYGGFSGSETDLGQRDLRTNRTVLDGNKLGTVVRIIGSRATVDGFTIQNGTGTKYTWLRGVKGGGILAEPYSAPTITNNRIVGNTAQFGAGMALEEFNTVTVVSNLIVDNVAEYDGGGVTVLSSQGNITNNTIVRNQAGTGGGLVNWCADTIVENNIVAFNLSGNGIYLHHNCSNVPLPTMDYNLVYGNLPGDYSAYGSGYPILEFPQPHDLQADPLFVDATAGDFHLQAASPAIDAGVDLYTYGAFTDLDGQPRLAGRAVDLGADEWVDAVPPTVVATVPLAGATNVLLTAAVRVTFGETVQAGAAVGQIALTYRTRSGGTVKVPASVTVVGSVLTITPTTAYPKSTIIRVTLPAGAVADLAGNQLAAPYEFTFITAKK